MVYGRPRPMMRTMPSSPASATPSERVPAGNVRRKGERPGDRDPGMVCRAMARQASGYTLAVLAFAAALLCFLIASFFPISRHSTTRPKAAAGRGSEAPKICNGSPSFAAAGAATRGLRKLNVLRAQIHFTRNPAAGRAGTPPPRRVSPRSSPAPPGSPHRPSRLLKWPRNAAEMMADDGELDRDPEMPRAPDKGLRKEPPVGQAARYQTPSSQNDFRNASKSAHERRSRLPLFR